MQSSTIFPSAKLWLAAILSAALLELPFPLAGPLPVWRTVFAWFGLVPLLCALLSPTTTAAPRPLRRAFLLGYLCGFLWYTGNCYWVRDTMLHYGDMPLGAPTLLLIGYSMVLGLYCGFFGLTVALVRRATSSTRLALVAAPFLWVGFDLAAARITCVPWDQLGYSQVDNALVNQLAPWTGVYGISFLLVAVNALLTGGLLLDRAKLDRRPHRWLSSRYAWAAAGLLLLVGQSAGLLIAPPQPATTATAVLVQPNLDVSASNNWNASGEWEQHIAQFARLASESCKSSLTGIPETGAESVQPSCPPIPASPTLVAWPESPAPFFENDPNFQQSMRLVAQAVQAPLVVGGVGVSQSPVDHTLLGYNSALVFNSAGAPLGRYDKIHLVPFGEYIPFQNLLTFAHKLTGRVGSTERGTEHKVFTVNGHRYGIFICYEAVFADEVRKFAPKGAEVLLTISDDGWYGDTSAPWQHLNMARMRAIENRRWLLRDTNNGVTAAIDPYGRVRQSIARHAVDALPAAYGFRSDVTFYSAHGDVFAWICAVLALVLIVWAERKLPRR